MDDTVAKVLQMLLEAVVLAVVSIGAIYLKQGLAAGVAYLQNKLGSEQFSTLKAFATTAVRSIEQSPIYTDFDGAKKKELAINAIAEWANSKGLPITFELIDKVIEEAVQVMNTGVVPAVALPTSEAKG